MLRRPEDMQALDPFAPEGFDDAALLSLNPARGMALNMGYKDREPRTKHGQLISASEAGKGCPAA